VFDAEIQDTDGEEDGDERGEFDVPDVNDDTSNVFRALNAPPPDMAPRGDALEGEIQEIFLKTNPLKALQPLLKA
jgi:hypothetical protein